MGYDLGLSLSKSLMAVFVTVVAPILLSACSVSMSKSFRDYFSPTSSRVQPDISSVYSAAPFVPPGLGPSPGGRLEVSLSEAILTGLSNNKSFEVQKFKPPITGVSEEVERAVFDPLAKVDIEANRKKSDQAKISRGFKVSTSVTELLPTGTTLELMLGTEYIKDELDTLGSASEVATTDAVKDSKYWNTLSTISINQALLRGAGLQANLANLRKARIDTQISMYELTGLAQALASDIEKAYWDYLLALIRVDIQERSLEVSSRLVRETRQRIAEGQKAEYEIYSFLAQESSTRQALEDAKRVSEKSRITLLRMISPPSFDLWNRKLRLLTKPEMPTDPVDDIASHIQVAMRMRPDLNQARLEEQKGNLEVVRTKNGLLPKLDAFIMLGRSGYAKNFDLSVNDYGSGSGGLDYTARIQFEFPPLNRKARADYNKSVLDVAKSRQAIDNLVQLAQQDVLLAYVEIQRAKDQIKISAETVKWQILKRDAEIEKYRLGVTSAANVTLAERETIASELSQAQARIDYLKGLTAFYVADGSLLARRGIGTVFSGQ